MQLFPCEIQRHALFLNDCFWPAIYSRVALVNESLLKHIRPHWFQLAGQVTGRFIGIYTIPTSQLTSLREPCLKALAIWLICPQCRIYASVNSVSIGSGNGLAPYCQLDPWEQTSVKFELKLKTCHSSKCIWNCHLRNGGHFVQGWVKLLLSTLPFGIVSRQR